MISHVHERSCFWNITSHPVDIQIHQRKAPQWLNKTVLVENCSPDWSCHNRIRIIISIYFHMWTALSLLIRRGKFWLQGRSNTQLLRCAVNVKINMRWLTCVYWEQNCVCISLSLELKCILGRVKYIVLCSGREEYSALLWCFTVKTTRERL